MNLWYIIIDILFNKGTWYILLIVAIIILNVNFNKRYSSLFKKFFLSFFIIIVATVVYISLINYIVNNVGTQSKVCIFSLSLLNDKQITYIEDVITRLGYNEKITITNKREFEDGFWLLSDYNIRWKPKVTDNPFNIHDLFIIARVHRYSESAISALESRANRTPYKHIIINNINDTSAFMESPIMEVSASGLFLPNNDRWLRSMIRVGNVVFDITEIRRWYTMKNNYTNQFIDLLVEASLYCRNNY